MHSLCLLIWFVFLVYPAGKFYCKPHYCYRLSGYAQRKRPAPAPAPISTKVFYLFESHCSLIVDNAHLPFAWLSVFLDSPGEPGASLSCSHGGCPWTGDAGSSPLSRALSLRYPTFLSCCGSSALPSGHECGSAYPPPHVLLDLPPGGTQPLRLSLPVHLLHLPLLLFHHQYPARPPLAWLRSLLPPPLFPFTLC